LKIFEKLEQISDSFINKKLRRDEIFKIFEKVEQLSDFIIYKKALPSQIF